MLEVFDGAVRPINRARKLGPEVKTDYGSSRGWVPDNDTYKPDEALFSTHQCAWAMCGTLWRDELYEIARLHGVEVKGRARVGPLTDAICGQMPVPKIHDAMIVELRRRSWRKPVLDLRGPRQESLFVGQAKT